MTSSLIADTRDNRFVAFAWGTAILLSFGFIFRDIQVALSVGKIAVAGGTILGRDFVNVFAGGHLVREGSLAIIYDIAAYHQYQWTLFNGLVENHNYSYSPITFLYVWLFALTPYGVSYLLWIGSTGAAFFYAARPYLREARLPSWAALILPAVAVNVWAGHYGLLIGALWLGAWQLMDKNPRTAGILVGLMIIKPHIALLMPLALARRRAWTSFIYAGLTIGALILLSGLIFGTAPWRAYLGNTIGYQAGMVDDVDQFFLMMMPTIAPSLFHIGLPPAIVWTVQSVAGVVAAGALWLRMPRDPRRAGLAVACATFLALPYAFNYDLTVVSLASLIVLHRAQRIRERPLLFAMAVLAFTLPLTTISFNMASIPLAPVLVAFLLCVLLSQREFTLEYIPRPQTPGVVPTAPALGEAETASGLNS